MVYNNSKYVFRIIIHLFALVNYIRFCYIFIPSNEDDTVMKYNVAWIQRMLTEICSKNIRLYLLEASSAECGMRQVLHLGFSERVHSRKNSP